MMNRPVTGTTPGCFFCVGNDMLAFARLTMEGVGGYAMPGSLAVEVDGLDKPVLTPMHYTYVLATDNHPARSDEFGGVWPMGWADIERILMRLLGISGGHNIIENYGTAHGQRPIGASTDHTFKWAVTNRHLVDELPADQPNVLPGTGGLGFATQIHRSRQAAGSIPDDVTLATWWLEILATVGNTVEAWMRFNRRVDRWRLNEA
jgi:hypothetical protein